jgi:hypothetical protein
VHCGQTLQPFAATAEDSKSHFSAKVTVYLCKRIRGASYPTIAMAVNRDHSACIHSFQTIASRVTGDPAFRKFFDQLENQITGTMAGNTGAASRRRRHEWLQCRNYRL